MGFKGYTIIETDFALMISDSRMSVYDVLQAQQEGDSLYEICGIYNLWPLQVQVAFEYIEENRERLDAELPKLLERKAERKRYYNALAAEREKEIRALPMTPKRKAFYELREKNRQSINVN